MAAITEPFEIQLARETLAAIDNGTHRLSDNTLRPLMGDAKFIPYGEAMAEAQRCVDKIIAAGFKPY